MKLSLNCSGITLLYGAILLLVLPLNWLLAAAAAASIHEAFHYMAVRCTGNRVLAAYVTHNGTVMKTLPMTWGEECFCALAGPAGSLLTACCYSWIPRISLCAAIQGAFNLLPLYPLDGGRAYRALLYLFFPACAENILRYTYYIVITCIAAVSIYCSMGMHLGCSPLFLCILLLSRCLRQKFLAKKGI